MYTIGWLSGQNHSENQHLNYLAEQGWQLPVIDLNEVHKDRGNLNALLIVEDIMSMTCSWIISLMRQVDVPIYLLSSGQDIHSSAVYLQLGVETCFPIKMAPEELHLTLNNILKRQSKHNVIAGESEKNTLGPNRLEIVPRNFSIVIDGKTEIILTKKEYQVMEILYNNPRKAITYEEFRKQMWNQTSKGTVANYRIANIIFHLRNKIEKNKMSPQFIKTIRSRGYMLDINQKPLT